MNKHRRSNRLSGHDYSSKGQYFVTICTKNRQCFFGQVMQGVMTLNQFGFMAKNYWKAIPLHFPHALLHEFIVMPNHVHGIIEICANSRWPVDFHDTINLFQSPSLTLGSIIRGYKAAVTKWARMNTNTGLVWQRGYYDHIIRNRFTYYKIVDYINRNPERWQHDMLRPNE